MDASLLPGGLPLILLSLGALAAGFTTGFAGFGTALIASGIWMHGLPPALIPPLVTIAAVIAHIVSLTTTRPVFDWGAARPYLVGALLGIPLGVAALKIAQPDAIRTAVGVFLLLFAASQLAKVQKPMIGHWGGRGADAVIGVGGGALGGFAGLSGPLPIVWLQLRGGPSKTHRAIFQPFNLVVLALAAVGMFISGLVTPTVLAHVAIATPLTVLGSWVGARAYLRVSEQVFRTVVLSLLFLSGLTLTVRGIF